MKILRCILFHLIFLLNNFQTIASNLRNESEESTNLLQKVINLENLFKENGIILETLQTSLHENNKIQDQILKDNLRFKQTLEQLSEIHNITLPSDECAKCQEQLNTVCDESTSPPVCSCTNTTFPIGGDATNGCKVCPSGYKVYPTFGCLKSHEERRDWETARKKCQSEDGDLFSPGDSLPILPKEELNLRDWHWIGVKRNSTEGSLFKRLSDSSVLPDESPIWHPKEPERGDKFECAYYLSYYERLFDIACHWQFPFICQLSI